MVCLTQYMSKPCLYLRLWAHPSIHAYDRQYGGVWRLHALQTAWHSQSGLQMFYAPLAATCKLTAPQNGTDVRPHGAGAISISGIENRSRTDGNEARTTGERNFSGLRSVCYSRRSRLQSTSVQHQTPSLDVVGGQGMMHQ